MTDGRGQAVRALAAMLRMPPGSARLISARGALLLGWLAAQQRLAQYRVNSAPRCSGHSGAMADPTPPARTPLRRAARKGASFVWDRRSPAGRPRSTPPGASARLCRARERSRPHGDDRWRERPEPCGLRPSGRRAVARRRRCLGLPCQRRVGGAPFWARPGGPQAALRLRSGSAPPLAFRPAVRAAALGGPGRSPSPPTPRFGGGPVGVFGRDEEAPMRPTRNRRSRTRRRPTAMPVKADHAAAGERWAV